MAADDYAGSTEMGTGYGNWNDPFRVEEKPFNPSDPKIMSEYIELQDKIKNSTRFIRKDSLEYTENFIDNFETIQLMTEDSTYENDFFKILFSNGKSRKFNLKEVPTSYVPSQRYIRAARLFYPPEYYVKELDGLIYPFFDGKVRYDYKYTFYLTLWRTKIEVHREIFMLQEAIAAFANLVAASASIHPFSSVVTNPPKNIRYNFKPPNPKVNSGKMKQHTYLDMQRLERVGKEMEAGKSPASLLSKKYSDKNNYVEVYLKAIWKINEGNGKLDRNGDMRVILYLNEHTGWVNGNPVQSVEVIFSDKGWHYFPSK